MHCVTLRAYFLHHVVWNRLASFGSIVVGSGDPLLSVPRDREITGERAWASVRDSALLGEQQKVIKDLHGLFHVFQNSQTSP